MEIPKATDHNPDVFLILLVLLVYFYAHCTPAAYCAVTGHVVAQDYVEIEKITDEILALEAELYRINTFFRLENGIQPAGRRWRMMFYQTTNYACTFAGLLANVIYNFYYYPRGGHATVIAQLGATTPRFVGKAVYVTGLLVETPLQVIEHYKEKKAGFDAHTTYKRVAEINKHLLELLTKREQAVLATKEANISQEEYKALQEDGKLLQDTKDLAVQEFAMLYARSVSLSIRNRFFNSLTLIKKTDADFGADLVRIIGGVNQNGFLSAPASMSTANSGYMSAFDPSIEMSSEQITYKSRYKNVVSSMSASNTLSVANLERDLSTFEKTTANIDLEKQPILYALMEQHDQFYKNAEGVVDSFQYLRHKELGQERQHDTHSLVYHAIYGGSKSSRGTWLIYVGFRYLHGFGHSKHSALLNGFAGIDNFSGATYRMADFSIVDYREIKNRKKDRVNNRANVAMVKSRFDALDAMEENTKVCSDEIKKL